MVWKGVPPSKPSKFITLFNTEIMGIKFTQNLGLDFTEEWLGNNLGWIVTQNQKDIYSATMIGS
jgi:hypothetical protein